MRKVIVIILTALFFLAGLGILLYPTIADYVNARSQSRVVTQYYDEVAEISETDYSQIINDAVEYNNSLLSKSDRFTPSEEDTELYDKLLSPNEKKVMGIITIEKINVRLPIYHGTSEPVLQVGVGHIEGSSLPIGGAGTHSALSGHRGLPSATLFTYLDRLTEGDVFTVTILNEVLTYQVDRIVVADPEQMEFLEIEDNMDYCTLITCTPYGINSHRILVRGVRIETVENNAQITINRALTSDAEQYNTFLIVGIITLAALVPSAIVGIVIFIRYSLKIKKLIKKLEKRGIIRR